MPKRFFLFSLAVLAGTAAFCLLTCAKRDNPFDPINYREPVSGCLRDSVLAYKAALVSHLAEAERSMAAAQAYTDTMRADSLIKYGVFEANRATLDSNLAKRNQNAIIGSINRSTSDPDSLQPKALIDTLTTISLNRSYNDTFAVNAIRIETVQLKIRALIAGFEASCPGNKDSLKSFNDSATAVINADAFFIHEAAAKSSVLLKDFGDSSAAITAWNSAIIAENAEILSYNENIVWLIKSIRFPRFTTADSLIAGIAAAGPGDTLIVDGELTVNPLLRFNISGTPGQPIVLMGSPKMTGIINATSGIIVTNQRYISLVNLVIQNSTASGFKAENSAGSILLENCVIRNNTLYGVEAVDSDLRIVDCKIMRNGKSGVRFSPTTVNNISLNNVLIVKNHGHGIELVSPSGDFNFVTISNNDSSGINIPTINNSFAIYNSLITYNNDFGVKATILPSMAGLITLRNDNFFGNQKGDIDTAGHYNYFSLEPGYADTAKDDFSLLPNGPLQGYYIGYQEKHY